MLRLRAVYPYGLNDCLGTDEFLRKLKHPLSHNLSDVPSISFSNECRLINKAVLLQNNLDDNINSMHF